MSNLTIFPSGASKTEIPIWVNFAAVPYNGIKTLEERSKPAITHVAIATDIIAMPYGGNIINRSEINYTADPNAVLMQIVGTLTNAEDIRLQGLSNRLEEDNNGVVKLTATPDTQPVANSSNKYLSVDMMDYMFLGGGFREIDMEFNLVCKSRADSSAAKIVCDIFSSRCWPLINTNSSERSGNARLMHPDIWIIWLSAKPGDIKKYDADMGWADGDGPLLSVLSSALTKRVGGENNRLLAIAANKGSDSLALPLQYQIALSFTELEVSVRDPTRNTVFNRSKALEGISVNSGSSSSDPE